MQEPAVERGAGLHRVQKRGTLLRRGIKEIGLVLLRREAVAHAGKQRANFAHGGIHAAHAVENDPLAVDENHVGLPPHHLDDQRAHGLGSHLVARVHADLQQALAVLPVQRSDARADKMLAQQHAEHRRRGGVFKAALGEMHARAADAAVHQKSGVSVVRAQAQQEQIALRLLHLVDSGADDLRLKLRSQPGEKHGVQRHFRAPPRAD